ncbi:MAG: nickel pincer cofactor biosynthesis protein LarB [Planctomycetes bacterium]|nr:nickel pincer cofactor biosynthesis protein LarB [Planctomycetota bacterium]
MVREELRRLLEGVRDARVSPGEALRRLAAPPVGDLGWARVDHQRGLRCGVPEVIYCEGKEPREVARIAREILRHGEGLLATRAGVVHARALRRVAPRATYHRRARLVALARPARGARPVGRVLVVGAGTSDLPVVEEVLYTARWLGARSEVLHDVGVAGLHRLLAHRDALAAARVVVAVAGKEGALPSVVGGLVSCPVVAVPTSVGYGASLGGLAALLSMLNTCAAGVTVVNIDNGFGAGVAAARINALAGPRPS